MKSYIKLSMLVFVVWAMDTQAADQADSATTSAIVELKGLTCNEGKFGLFLPTSLQDYAALGKPMSEKSGPAGYEEPDNGSSQEVTHDWYIFEYPGLSVHAVAALKKPYASFVQSAVVSDARWNKYFGIKVGTSITDILPHTSRVKISTSSPLMFCGSLVGEPDCAKVLLKHGIILKVEYQCFTG